jgi:hypothetical protein
MSELKLTKRQREIIYVNTAMLTKAFLELHSYTSHKIKDVKKTKNDAIALCTQILGTVSHCLDLHVEDFKKLHDEIDSVDKINSKLSESFIDDYINKKESN